MILDKKLELCDAVSVALTAGATPQNVGNIIDLDAARDIGNGEQLFLVVTVDTEIITGGSAGTIQFQLVSDSSDTIATNGSQTIHFVSNDFVTDGTDANAAELKAGKVPVCVALPVQGVPYERYLALQVIVLTTDTTAGKINAFITKDPTGWKAYPNAAGA